MAWNIAPEHARREAAARRELERHGLRLRDANVRYRGGELDLVMDHGEVLVFVEVRYRRGASFGGGVGSVNAAKCRKMARAAGLYLASHPFLASRTCRFDVMSMSGEDEAPRFEWIRNAFTLDEVGTR